MDWTRVPPRPDSEARRRGRSDNAPVLGMEATDVILRDGGTLRLRAPAPEDRESVDAAVVDRAAWSRHFEHAYSSALFFPCLNCHCPLKSAVSFVKAKTSSSDMSSTTREP